MLKNGDIVVKRHGARTDVGWDDVTITVTNADFNSHSFRGMASANSPIGARIGTFSKDNWEVRIPFNYLN